MSEKWIFIPKLKKGGLAIHFIVKIIKLSIKEVDAL